MGKSECALALVERGHSLVADDITVIKLLDERELMASSRPLTRGYMECRGIGIINIAEMFGIKSVRLEKRIDMVVSLREWTPDAVEERTGLEENYYEILGIKLPHIELFVRPGRDIARLVEVAAMVQALKRMGHDPAKDFNDRLIAHMAEQPDAGTKKPLRLSATPSPARGAEAAAPRPVDPGGRPSRQTSSDIPAMSSLRSDGRRADQLRPVAFEAGPAPYAAGSVLARFGNTQVICAATIEPKVPVWMRQQGLTGGWLTAEYSMLPYSTLERKPRDITRGKLDGRTVEIQRLIGRSLRAVLDLQKLGDNTLWIDCDVLQADGGTRTASITGRLSRRAPRHPEAARRQAHRRESARLIRSPP